MTLDYTAFDKLPEMIADFALDVANGSQERSELVGALNLVKKLKSATYELSIAVESALIDEAKKEPFIQDGSFFKAEQDFKDRPNQDYIYHSFVKYMIDDLGIDEAAAWKIVGVVTDMYISPSTVPKKTGLDKIGAVRKEAITREYTKDKLVEIVTTPKEPND